MDHPFLQTKQLPNWSAMLPEKIEADINKTLQSSKEAIDEISQLSERNTNLNYTNTFAAFEKALDPLNTSWGFVNHLDNVNNSKELRKAFNTMLPKVTQFYTDIPLNQDLWKVLKRFGQSESVSQLSPTQKRHIEETLADFREEGADLPNSKKEQVRNIQKDLAELTQRYSENCLDATNAWDHIVNDASQLEGLPKSSLQAAKESAESKGHKNAWRFTLDATSYIPVMSYAKNCTLRKTLWQAYQSIGREAPYDNQDLVTQILKLRHTYAQIIGKESFAEYTTNRRMVKNGHAASSFIESMHKQIKSAFDKECTLLKDYKASKTVQAESALEPWDIGYWSERHQKEYYQFDEEALRPYFPIEKVINGLFSICEKLFHLSIEPIEAIYILPEAVHEKEKLNPKQLPEVWHPDVKLYNLYDEQTNTLLGSFYADWHPRESKRSGAWMNYLRTGTRTETHTPHLGLICGNLPPPLKDTPSLLTHHEVETIFHEFGHLLHHLCGTVEVPSLNGVNVAWDFVELPSQIMENWCWERESLDLFARHYETDEPIPQDLFEKMQACKNHFKAMGTMRQLSLAKLDLDLHRDWILDSSQFIDNYLKQRLKDYHFTFSTPTRPIICNFGHLFSSTTGYAAGYYSYKYAEVLDADAFTRFQKEGLLNPETGLAFRNTILANGNSKDPYQLFQDFMGRKPKTDALLKRDGIIA